MHPFRCVSYLFIIIGAKWSNTTNGKFSNRSHNDDYRNEWGPDEHSRNKKKVIVGEKNAADDADDEPTRQDRAHEGVPATGEYPCDTLSCTIKKCVFFRPFYAL